MVSLKMFSVLLCIMAMLLGFGAANPLCGKNAWVALTNTGITDGQASTAYGTSTITSGKDANDISWDTFHKAITDCLFDNQNCRWDGYNYNCDVHPAWIRSDWKATLNIEFSCTDGDYTCYSAKWY